MDHSVSEIMADIWPLPSTLKVESGHSIFDPTLSAGHLSGQAACMGAWDVYRRYPFTICGGVLLAAAPFLSKGN